MSESYFRTFDVFFYKLSTTPYLLNLPSKSMICRLDLNLDFYIYLPQLVVTRNRLTKVHI